MTAPPADPPAAGPLTTPEDVADRALKAAHRAVWASGDYPSVARELVAPLAAVLLEACPVGPDDAVLDVAAGTGNVARLAARTGARVVASDLTPELLEEGRRTAVRDGVELEWRQADAEALPVDDASFDVVLSCIGVMFAPHHQRAADELVRACRSGGRLGLLSWTPTGFIGELFATMRPYVPAPPPGVSPAPLWGQEQHVRELLGDRVEDLRARTGELRVDRFDSPEDFRDYFAARYGPTLAVRNRLADEPERRAALDRDLAALAARHGAGTRPMAWEYLVVTARRRS